MKLTTLSGFVLLLCAVASADESTVEFTTKPSVIQDGKKAIIHFEMSAGTDVEVGILDAKGEVVRHLAAGVLGGKKPPPPFASGLSQRIEWDRCDDYGDPVADASTCSVRVRAGMGVRLDRIVGGDPYAFYSSEMGQGDHAAWRITGLEAKSDGTVYVLGNANNYGPPALRRYDARGDYLSTVFPPPAGKKLEEVKGWGIYAGEDGAYAFQYNDLSSPALSLTPICGTRGSIATLIPSADNDRLLLERDYKLMGVNTDGSVPLKPILDDLLVNEPALAPAVKNPRRGPWKLTGPRQICPSLDGRHFYLSGVFAGAMEQGRRVGAEPTGPWRDGQVFKVDVATRKASVFFALDEDQVISDLEARQVSPIADARYGAYAALQGVAVDAEGRVFICDRQNERILVLDPDGKIIREIPLAYADVIAVGPKSKALFVTTRTGHFHGKGELRLLKFSDWSKDTVPVSTVRLCEVRHYSQPTRLAVVEFQGEVFVWVAYTTLPVRVYRDEGAELELVKDFYEAGPQRALDLQHISVDSKTGDIYVPDGFDRCFRITDWDDPIFERCMQDEQTPLPALSVAIDARNRWLYAHADRKEVVRYKLDGKFLSPAPVGRSAEDSNVTPILSNDWRIGLGHGDRGIAAAPDGSLATLGALGKGPDYSGYLRYFDAAPDRAPWDGRLFKNFGEKVRAAGVRFDVQGNLYAGKIDGEPGNPPKGFENDANFLRSTGRIYKYAATGSLRSGNLFPTEPVAPEKVYDVQYGAIGPKFARTPRFGVDGYGRIYYPTSLASRVTVIDNEGNPVIAFGAYGNRDSMGKLEGDLVPTADIPMAWPNSVDATDDYIYVSDIVNIRLLRIAKTFALDALVRIPAD
jgi:hypothetical protein